MNWQQPKPIRRKIFISYHEADSNEVNIFVNLFSNAYDTFLDRGIGAGMTGDIINSNDTDYVMSRIRELYLADSTVTIVMIGNCTWSQKYVDWELQSSLRSGKKFTPNGVLGIRLPSYNSDIYPERLNANLLPDVDRKAGRIDCYARVINWPLSVGVLRSYIEDAYNARTLRSHLINNTQDRFKNDRDCGHSWH